MKKLKLLLAAAAIMLGGGLTASALDAPTASTPVVGNVYYLYNQIEGKFLSLDGNTPYVRNTGLAWKLEDSETAGYITLHVNNTSNGYLWGKWWANYAGDYANYPNEARFKLVEKEAGSTYKLHAGAWDAENAYVYLNYGRVACNSQDQSNLDEAYTLWQFVTEADYITFMSEKYSAGDDVTDFINNYHFTNCSQNNFPGWMISNPNNGNAQPLGDTDVEYWIGTASNGNFDFYQTVTGLPEGRYTISASMFNSGNGVAGNAANGNAGVYGTSNGNTAFAGVTIDSDRDHHNTYSTSIFVNNNELRLGVKNNGTMGARWFGVDWIMLNYVGKIVQDYAVALPTDGTMAADTWYYFDIAAAADNYDATATELDKIICTSDANALTSIATGNITLTAKNNALEATRYYVKSTSDNKLVVAASSFTYSVSEATLDKTYIQPGQTVTVSYTVSTNDPDATLGQNYSGVTFNGEAVTCTATASGFTFTVPTGIATAAELTLTIPAGAIGYAAGDTFNADQSFTLKTPAVFDGTYFFKVENDGALKGQYLSRGKNYGTHATIDKYGLAIKVATDGDNKTTLKPFDTNLFYRMGNTYDCWADQTDNDDYARFNLVAYNGNIRIHAFKNADAEDYFKYDNADVAETTKIWADSHSGGNGGNILEFSLETGAEHGAAMQTMKDNQAASAAAAAATTSDYTSLSGITTANALETELTTNYIQGDFVAPTEISSVLEKYQKNGDQPENAPEVVYSNTIHITEPGFYKFSMQAFYRAGGNERAQEMHNAGIDYNPVVLFFGDNQTQIKSLYDEAGREEAVVASGNWGADSEYNGKFYPNCMDGALQYFKDGMYHNDVWLYISAAGEYSYGVKYLGYANHNAQWFIYSPQSVTITSYAAAASAADYEALNAAIAESEGKTLGFETGEYAPYNNAAAFKALADAKAIDQNATNSKLIVETAIAEMNVWVANTEEVNAFADPTFAKSGNDGAQLGWITDHSEGLGGAYHARAFVLESGAGNYDNLAAFGQGDGTRSAGYFRFDGTNSAKTTTYTYGETDGYTIPLKAYVYNLTAQIGGWGQVDKDVIVQVVSEDGDVVGTQTVHTPTTGVHAGGSVVDVNLIFKAPAAGNYKVQLKNGSTDADNAIVISNLDLRRPSNVYAVAGNNTDIFPDGWNITAEMDYLTLNEGKYTMTYADQMLDKQTIEFKVVKKDRVESTDAAAWYPANNVSISIPVKGIYNITISFDGNESNPTVTGVATKTAEAVTIGSTGWATTVTNSALNFANSGVEAYTATVANDEVTLKKVNDVKAETGLVLKATAGTYYVPVIESSTTDKGSLLYKSTESYWTWHDNGGENNKFYGLIVNNDGDAQFRLINCSAGNEVEIPGGKAFLLINSSNAARDLKVVFADEATGIDAVVAEKNIEGIYNMNGQRVTAPAKGLYIVNGKKVVLK